MSCPLARWHLLLHAWRSFLVCLCVLVFFLTISILQYLTLSVPFDFCSRWSATIISLRPVWWPDTWREFMGRKPLAIQFWIAKSFLPRIPSKSFVIKPALKVDTLAVSSSLVDTLLLLSVCLLSSICFAAESVMVVILWWMLCHHCLFGPMLVVFFVTESMFAHYLAKT